RADHRLAVAKQLAPEFRRVSNAQEGPEVPLRDAELARAWKPGAYGSQQQRGAAELRGIHVDTQVAVEHHLSYAGNEVTPAIPLLAKLPGILPPQSVVDGEVGAQLKSVLDVQVDGQAKPGAKRSPRAGRQAAALGLPGGERGPTRKGD